MDVKERVFFVKPTAPQGWDAAVDGVEAALKHFSDGLTVCQKHLGHGRGSYPSVAFGNSFGGGQEVRPHHLSAEAG